MANRPSPPCYLRKGQALSSSQHIGFVDTFNWMLSSLLHFAVGAGLSLTGTQADRPKLELNLEAGDHIKIEPSGKAYKISYVENDADSGGTTRGGDDPEQGGTGASSSSSPHDPDGSETGGELPGGGSSGAPFDAPTDDMPSGGSGSSCNGWSDDVTNADGDAGMSNPGDDCDTLNGW